MLQVFENRESNVRGYVRLFPTVFDRAKGSELWDEHGTRYIDFFCGAGTLNYGHNNPRANEALVDYIKRDGIQHGLDTATRAKARFITTFNEVILQPRGLDYRIQFTGPTGTNAVEAAIKLARKATGRSHVVAFTHAYHGHSLGSLALTANSYFHDESYGSHNNVTHLPFDGYCGDFDTADLLEKYLEDGSSGLPIPAAIILETVQGEGGINVASEDWLKRIADISRKHGVLLIVDDIQVGNGRTGNFFSFERAGIEPDMVCLSKSLGGGLPLSLVLIKPEADVWQAGQHTGTFRGNNLAFVTARALLDYWRTDLLESKTFEKATVIEAELDRICERYAPFERRGIGLIQGLDVGCGKLARNVIDACFSSGLLLESSGANDEVLKVLPALTIEPELLAEGLSFLTLNIHRAANNLDTLDDCGCEVCQLLAVETLAESSIEVANNQSNPQSSCQVDCNEDCDCTHGCQRNFEQTPSSEFCFPGCEAVSDVDNSFGQTV